MHTKCPGHGGLNFTYSLDDETHDVARMGHEAEVAAGSGKNRPTPDDEKALSEYLTNGINEEDFDVSPD